MKACYRAGENHDFPQSEPSFVLLTVLYVQKSTSSKILLQVPTFSGKDFLNFFLM